MQLLIKKSEKNSKLIYNDEKDLENEDDSDYSSSAS